MRGMPVNGPAAPFDRRSSATIAAASASSAVTVMSALSCDWVPSIRARVSRVSSTLENRPAASPAESSVKVAADMRERLLDYARHEVQAILDLWCVALV